jgi:hypothetical protein
MSKYFHEYSFIIQNIFKLKSRSRLPLPGMNHNIGSSIFRLTPQCSQRPRIVVTRETRATAVFFNE